MFEFFSLISSNCSLIFFTFVFARCEWPLKSEIWRKPECTVDSVCTCCIIKRIIPSINLPNSLLSSQCVLTLDCVLRTDTTYKHVHAWKSDAKKPYARWNLPNYRWECSSMLPRDTHKYKIYLQVHFFKKKKPTKKQVHFFQKKKKELNCWHN